MLRNRRKQLGNVSIEQALLIGTMALAGTAGFGMLGKGFETSLLGDGAGSEASVGTSVSPTAGAGAMAVARQAGNFSAAVVERLAKITNETGQASFRVSDALAKFERNPLKHLNGTTVRWDRIEPRHVEPAVDWALRKAERRFKGVVSRFRPQTYRGKIEKMEHGGDELQRIFTALGHLDGTTDAPELSAAFDAARAKLSAVTEASAGDDREWRAVQKFAESRAAKRLTGERKRYFEQVVETHRKNGADLPEAARIRLTKIETELNELRHQYGRNAMEAQQNFEFFFTDPAQLVGLSDGNIARAKASAESVGKEGYRFTLGDGTAGTLLTFGEDAGTRETIWRAMQEIGVTGDTNNQPIIERILALRREKAQTLGFKDYVDYITSDRMAKSGDAAQAFVDDLAAKTEPYFKAELEDFRAFREAEGGPDELLPWDNFYWQAKWGKSKKNTVNVAEFFPMDHVVEGVFTTAERIYGVKFEEFAGAVWADGVRSFRVTDESGRHLGNLQVDLLARPGKRGGAWMQQFKLGLGDEPSLGIVSANFGPATPGGPVLLQMREVETVFHEFGHALHLLMSDAKVQSLGGVNVAWDFVELPSQIMENFVWERETLGFLTKHYKTGETMPEHVMAYLQATRSRGAAMSQMAQLSNAAVDLAIHRVYDPAVHGDVMRFARSIQAPFQGTKSVDAGNHLATFTHIFSGGYAGGYYGYKWSELLDADAFSRFKADGVFSRKVGEEFRRKLLSRGDTNDPAELFRDFMGRDPDPTALQRRQGMAN